ncbi:MAG: hypothetical protein O7A08_13175, partial [SAR324 cluster bacterium]|nr:hypothetical protein [SAR324 cluster bacterium]
MSARPQPPLAASRGKLRAFRDTACLFTALLLVPLHGLAGAPLLDAPFVAVSGGRFVMGDPAGEPDEVAREAAVGPFRLMKLEV